MPDSTRFALHRPELRGALYEGDAKIGALMRGSRKIYGSGDTLIEANTEHPYVYRLVDGWAARVRRLDDGREQFILIFLPGDLFAVKSMFVLKHPDRVSLLTDAVVERIHYQRLYAEFAKDGDVATRCLWQVMEEERRLHSWVTGLGQGSAEERLALLLIDLHGRLVSSGAIPSGTLTFGIPLTQTQIGDHLGLTPVHVNRTLRALRERGLATIRERTITIHDLEGLAECAGSLLDPYERASSDYVGARREPQ